MNYFPYLYLSFFSLPAQMDNLTLKDSKQEEGEEQRETFIAFARVYSGVIKKGQRVFVLGPKYDPAQGLSMVKPHLSINLYLTCSALISRVRAGNSRAPHGPFKISQRKSSSHIYSLHSLISASCRRVAVLQTVRLRCLISPVAPRKASTC